MEGAEKGFEPSLSGPQTPTPNLNHNISSFTVKYPLLREMVGDREAWHAAVHKVSKSQTRLSDWITTTIHCPVLHRLPRQSQPWRDPVSRHQFQKGWRSLRGYFFPGLPTSCRCSLQGWRPSCVQPLRVYNVLSLLLSPVFSYHTHEFLSQTWQSGKQWTETTDLPLAGRWGVRAEAGIQIFWSPAQLCHSCPGLISGEQFKAQWLSIFPTGSPSLTGHLSSGFAANAFFWFSSLKVRQSVVV